MKYKERFELVQSLDQEERLELAVMLTNYLDDGYLARFKKALRYPSLKEDKVMVSEKGEARNGGNNKDAAERVSMSKVERA